MRVTGIILFVVSGFLILTSCTRSLDNKAPKPVNLIPRDTMVNIVVDLRIMDAILVRGQRQGKKSISDFKYYLDGTIMNKYNITHEQFDSSFYYYESNLKVLDAIYADAITKLTLMKSEPLDEDEE